VIAPLARRGQPFSERAAPCKQVAEVAGVPLAYHEEGDAALPSVSFFWLAAYCGAGSAVHLRAFSSNLRHANSWTDHQASQSETWKSGANAMTAMGVTSSCP
jgi:hypothetical protein